MEHDRIAYSFYDKFYTNIYSFRRVIKSHLPNGKISDYFTKNQFEVTPEPRMPTENLYSLNSTMSFFFLEKESYGMSSLIIYMLKRR